MKRLETLALHRGFTLAELVATIVIIGILAAVAIPNMSSSTDEAKKAKASAIFGSLKASYATQKAIKKGGDVLVSEIVAGHDPGCSASVTASICGNATVNFVTEPVPAPAGWGCTVNDITVSTTC